MLREFQEEIARLKSQLSMKSSTLNSVSHTAHLTEVSIWMGVHG